MLSNNTMPKPSQGFPPSSNVLQRKWEERKYKSHRDKVHGMTTGLDTTAPKKYPHLLLSMKKIQLEEERQAKIDHDNQQLLEKIGWIMKNRGRLDNWNDVESKSLNEGYRNREAERIANENIRIAKSLDQVKPVYKVKKWEKDYEAHEHHMHILNDTTKSYAPGVPARRRGKLEYVEVEYEESEAQSEDSTLPKVSVNRKRKDSKRESLVPKLPKLSEPGDKKAENPVDADAKLIFKGCKGMGDIDEIVFKTLIKKSHNHRMNVKNKFPDLFDLDMEKELRHVMKHPSYQVLLDVLLGDKDGADAQRFHKAITTKDIKKLVGLICSKSNSDMVSIHEAYSKKYDSSLESDIKQEFEDVASQRLFFALMKDGRSESSEVDEELAQKEAEEIHEWTVVSFGDNSASYMEVSKDDQQESGDGRWVNDNGKFMKLLSERSFPQIRATFQAYRNATGGRDIMDSVANDCTGDFVQAVNALAGCILTPSALYAEKINNIMSAKDPEFINLMIFRSDHEMPGIRKAYKRKYNVELADDIRYRCKGDVVNLLVEMANRTPPKGAKGAKEAAARFRKFGHVALAASRKKSPSKRPEAKHDNHTLKDNPLAHTGKTKTDQTHKPKKDHDKKSKAHNKPPPHTHGTIKAFKDFNVDQDVKAIKEAVAGFGTDEEPLIVILSSRSNEQRQEIMKKYQEKYKKDLSKELGWELTGDFEELISALLLTPTDFDAFCLHDATDGLGTREAALIGILVTRNAKEIKAIKTAYKAAYDSDLADDIKSDTSGDFQELLLELLRAERDQTFMVDGTQAKEDAKLLHKDGEGALIPSDEAFKEILTKKNRQQVKAIFDEYELLAGHDIKEGIRKATFGDAEQAYLALVDAITDPVLFYAERLKRALDDNNDKMLIRIIVSRSEIDLKEIKSKFAKLNNGTTLENCIQSQCSGDYKRMLLAIVEH